MTDDARPPLRPMTLGPPWTAIQVVEVTESTNADLIGAAPGSVLVAEFQRAGRGRLDRSWTSPPRAGLTFSAVVAPNVIQARWGWLPLLTGVAVCDAVRAITGVAAVLKWPNDVLVGERKLAGVLVQADAARAVIGVGLNVSTTAAELPVASATSLAIEHASVLDRGVLLAAILAELGRRYDEWTAAAGDAVACGLAADYRDRCASIGRPVRVTTGDREYVADALGVDDDARLRLRTLEAGVSGEQALAAGDIVHLYQA